MITLSENITFWYSPLHDFRMLSLLYPSKFTYSMTLHDKGKKYHLLKELEQLKQSKYKKLLLKSSQNERGNVAIIEKKGKQ